MTLPARNVNPAQVSRFQSPWSLKERLRRQLWEFCWAVFCRWTPKPANAWRLFWLRLFNAKIDGKPFVHQHARIAVPWRLSVHEDACIGDGANIYSLGEIEIGARAVVAQETYLSTGTHDFSHPALPLAVAKIMIGEDSFLGARVFVLPGVTIGARAIIGACSVVTQDVPDDVVAAGNPCRVIRQRKPELVRRTDAGDEVGDQSFR